jgi:hypothetical protein
MSGSSSRVPVATMRRRAVARLPLSVTTSNPPSIARASVTSRVLDHAIHGADLTVAVGDEIERRVAVPAQHAVHVGREAIARPLRVEHEHAAAGAGEDERGAEAGGTAADDDDVPVLARDRGAGVGRGGGCCGVKFVHASSVPSCYAGGNYRCQIGKERACMTTVSPSSGHG